jgi:hypothetical protein
MQRADVIEACTRRRARQVYGEEVVAYVVLRPGSASAARHPAPLARRRCRRFKTPKQIVLSDELPKTERGKLDRKALVERWTAEQRRMKLKDEPNNWIGLVLILVLILVFALVIRWAGLPKSPPEYRASAHPRPPLAALSQRLDNLRTTSRESSHARLCAHAPLRRRDIATVMLTLLAATAATRKLIRPGRSRSSCRSARAAPPTFWPGCSADQLQQRLGQPFTPRTAAARPARSPRRPWRVRPPMAATLMFTTARRSPSRR